MKSKKLLLSTLVLFSGIATFIFFTSSSDGMTGVMGASSTGCSGAGVGCHVPSPGGVQIEIAGIPVAGFTAGSTYTLSLNVTHTKANAGFDLQVSGGTLSNAPANTMLMGGIELHHTAPKAASSGVSTWVFNWTAPTVITAPIIFNVAANATNADGTSSGDGWTPDVFTFTQNNVGTIDQSINKSDIKVYPNPSTNYLNIKTELTYENINFTAISLNGSSSNVQYKKIGNGEYQIDTHAFTNGIYILKIHVDGKMYNYPFTKK